MPMKGSEYMKSHVTDLIPQPPPKLSLKLARWKILQIMQRQLLSVIKHYCNTTKLSHCDLYLVYIRSPNLNRLCFKTARYGHDKAAQIIIEAGLDEALAYTVTEYQHPMAFDLPTDACSVYTEFDDKFIEDLVQQVNLSVAHSHVDWNTRKSKHRKPRPPLF